MNTSERLRQWADSLAMHGPDISHWGILPFVIAELRRMAAEVEELQKIADEAEETHRWREQMGAK